MVSPVPGLGAGEVVCARIHSPIAVVRLAVRVQSDAVFAWPLHAHLVVRVALARVEVADKQQAASLKHNQLITVVLATGRGE